MVRINIIMNAALLLLALVCLGAGYYLGTRSALTAELTKNLDQFIKRKSSFPFCIAEYESGNYYLYDKETKAFLGQSSTIDGLAAELSNTRRINLAFVTYPTDIGSSKIFWFINGKAKSVSNES